MPPKPFKAPRPSITPGKKITKQKSTSTSARKSTASTASTSKPRSRAKESSTSKKPSRILSLPSLSPASDVNSEPDPFASSDEVQSVADDDEVVSLAPQREEEDERKESIPADLLTKLLHENFKQEGTRLSRGAGRAVGRYMETFVREALARAAFERLEVEEGGAGIEGGFLEVEDLEKLAPQLLLDF